MLQRAVRDGNIPTAETLAEFAKDSERMAEFTEPEWQEAMHEYMDHLANLKRAAADNQLEVIAHELRDLAARWAACHRDFK